MAGRASCCTRIQAGSGVNSSRAKAPDPRIPPFHPPLQKKRLRGLGLRWLKKFGGPRWLPHARRRRKLTKGNGAAGRRTQSQGHLPHRMRHPLERQPPLAARRPRPVREQARRAEVEVGAARRGTRATARRGSELALQWPQVVPTCTSESSLNTFTATLSPAAAASKTPGDATTMPEQPTLRKCRRRFVASKRKSR